MDWIIKLTANSVDDSDTLLRILSTTIANSGGWVLMRTTSAEGEVQICFEFEREACIDIYTVLMAAGLELSQSSHLQLTQLCHCTRSREVNYRHSAAMDDEVGIEPARKFEPARVDLRIIPGQLGVFEPKPERDAGDPAWRFRR